MKNSFLDPEFCDFWERSCGDEGQIYERYVFEPLLFSLLGDLEGKHVVELGSGNGALAKRLLSHDLSQLTLLDISPHNLQYAKNRCGDDRIRYLCQDAALCWDISSESMDVVVSHMVLNEMEDIQTPLRESFRVLRKGGQIICSVFHPAFDLYVWAQEKAGLKQRKIRELDAYFIRKFCLYDMGLQSRTNARAAKEYDRDFLSSHFHRPVSDYFSAFVEAGFRVDKLLEPEITIEVLNARPAFEAYKDRPLSLVLVAMKGA